MGRALVIDDSKAIRMILTRTLVQIGYEVVALATADEAICALEQDKGVFTLALVDWNMPGMNGLEFVHRVRADSDHDGLTLIMVTTETSMCHMTMALDAGANDYVMKPFTKEMIEEKLSALGVLQ